MAAFDVIVRITNGTRSDNTRPLDPQLFDDESYTLDISSSSRQAVIVSSTEYGALHALQTFVQLVEFDVDADGGFQGQYLIKYLPIRIRDEPRFAWRGLLVDTSRHFISVEKLLTVIDGLSANKMNVFHWHAVDDHSHPLYSSVHPDISLKGAYRPYEIYTTEDIARIVEYASERGIRTMLELDMPSHCSSWSKGAPEIIIACESYEEDDIYRAALMDPRPPTYDYLRPLFAEMKQLFPSLIMHIGVDEVVHRCWEESEELTQWRDANGFQNWDEVQAYFLENVLAIIEEELGLTAMMWHEGIVGPFNVSNRTIAQIWNRCVSCESNPLVDAVRRGHYAVTSRGWYLDQQVPNLGPPPIIHYGSESTWRDMYTNDAYNGAEDELTDEEKARVLGGEACSWSEQQDGHSIHARVFARVAAAAERLWSPREFTDPITATTQAESRLVYHRCELVRRHKIDAVPVAPDYCDEGGKIPLTRHRKS